MIDIPISSKYWQNWQNSVDLLSSFSQCAVVVRVVNASGQYCPKLSSASLNNHQVLEESCIADLANNSHILKWPSRAVFGYLSLCLDSEKTEVNPLNHSEDRDIVPVKLEPLLALCIKNIELELSEIYREHQHKNKLERGPIASLEDVSLQLFIDSLKEHIWIKDTSGRYMVCNQSVERAWGKTREEIINKTDEELFVADLANQFIQADHDAVDTGIQITTGECKGQNEDVDKYWLETSKVPLVAEDGELLGVVGVSRNISQHKAVQEELEITGRIFENSVEGVLITDRKGEILETYGAFSEITGYSKDEVVGKNPRMFSSGRHDKAFFTELWSGLIHKGKWHGEIWNRRKNGAVFPQMLTVSSVFGEDGEVRYFVAVFADITLQKRSEAELAHQAYHDPLTQLPNRMALITLIEQDIRHAEVQQGHLATVFIDVDLFKHINDSFGHLAGDKILVELAGRLTSHKGSEDTLARIGGDEFVVLLPQVEGNEELTLALSKLRKAFEQPFFIDDKEPIRLTASMGVSVFPQDGKDSYTLLRNADSAKHRAKLDGRNSYAFYTESLTQESREHLKLQSALHAALDKQNFHLVYQPKLDFVTMETTGFEALLRWCDPVLGNVSPAKFIPIAEKTGLINDIGLWVLKQACQQGVKWISQGKKFGRIAVNVAGQQLQRTSFVDEVKLVLEETGLPASALELEVTESFMMSDPEVVIRDLQRLGEMGIELSIDDFGTGYSSLSYLKKLPIHKLKIDQSFVRDLPMDHNNSAIAKAVIALGQALNLKVIAEGVENEAQAAFLRDNGCDEAQGYLYSKPMLPEALNDFLD
ncbi:EAL domain-containing protein [Shewanella benthica]|uniref:sensor domain-containing protein n=1 Tax=Shewanella benthica TaxID=43661 RepID=UPI00187ACF7E|nr:bifunctional diguanylate cyclase/phosphodiesterase [Shewanella benthica]MBE7216652.1 EAL domain-containing protein [Shewanella benthica]MCL1064779.1 EAL domain-containing protein [Shewanella benthica]